MIVVIGIVGFSGRMGQALARAIDSHPHAALAGGLTRSETLKKQAADAPQIVTDDPTELFPQCDVIVDFSHPSATPIYARLAANAGKAFLSGTTGLEADGLAVLRESAEKIPVLHATNTSLSLVVARHLTRLCARMLKDQDYDVSILDKHHRWKKDSPSGTALALGQAVEQGDGGAHPPTYAAIRSGAIVGEHEVLFAGPGETLALHHSVTDRRVFARGAVQAAVWLARQSPGFYAMDDVLGIAPCPESGH